MNISIIGAIIAINANINANIGINTTIIANITINIADIIGNIGLNSANISIFDANIGANIDINTTTNICDIGGISSITAGAAVVNIFNTIITPIVLSGNDRRILWNNK